MNIYRLLQLIFLIPFMSSCGQTGPLYLPGTPPPIHTERERSPQPADEKTPESTPPSSSKN
jgi:predicted small lipoprotein YifL